jgi:transaldolase
VRFFLDSASSEDARRVRDWGLLDGVWVSPGSAEAAGIEYRRAIRELSGVSDGPICVLPEAEDAKGMYKDARELAKLGKDVVVRLPIDPEGMRVARLLAEDQIAICASGCYSAAQALIAARANVSYVAPAVGPLDEVGTIGMDLVEQIIRIYDNYGFQTQILVAELRNPVHVLDAALKPLVQSVRKFLANHDHCPKQRGPRRHGPAERIGKSQTEAVLSRRRDLAAPYKLDEHQTVPGLFANFLEVPGPPRKVAGSIRQLREPLDKQCLEPKPGLQQVDILVVRKPAARVEGQRLEFRIAGERQCLRRQPPALAIEAVPVDPGKWILIRRGRRFGEVHDGGPGATRRESIRSWRIAGNIPTQP